MKRPNPEAHHRRTTQLLALAQEIRDTAKRDHAAVDIINPETHTYVYGEDERRTKHAKIREQALKALDALGLRSLDAETAQAAEEANAYLSVDAILGRPRFTPEPLTEEDYARQYPGRDSPSWNPIAEETRRRDREFGRTLTDIRELMQRADAERDVARLDDAARAQRVKQAKAENNLAIRPVKSHSDFRSVAAANLRELPYVGIHRIDFRGHVGEHLRSAEPRRHRNHFGTALAEAEPVRRACGKMDKGALRRRSRLVADAEIDLPLGDEEGLVPGMTVRRRPTALGPTLEEDFIAFGGFARCEHGDVFADDIEWARVVLWCDDERFCRHPGFSFLSIDPAFTSVAPL
jgi:hypothetical protein